MHYTITAILSLCAFVSTAWAQQPKVIKPGRGGATYVYNNNPRYREGSEMQFQWSSGIDNIRLVLWQEWPVVKVGTNYYDELMKDGGDITTYDWVVKVINPTLLKDGEDAVLYFDIMDANDTTKRRIDSSSYFNVTRAAQPKVSSSLTSSVASTKTTALSQGTATSPDAVASPTDTSSSSSSSSTASDSGDDGLSKGAIAGIAVGATLGGILLLGGLGFLLGKKFARRNKSKEGDSGVQSPWTQPTQPPSELPSPKVELPVQERDYSHHQYYKYNQAVPPVVHEAP